MSPTPTLVVTVPGPWGKRSDLVAAVRKADTGFVFAGRNLKKAATDDPLPVSVDEHDADLAAAFASDGPAAGIGAAELAATAVHPRVARLGLVAQGPLLALKALEFSAALVCAGGYGVRVESARKVVSAQTWIQYAANAAAGAATGDAARAVYAAFVSLKPMPDGSCYYSTGMQAMNLPDAAAPADLSAQKASEVLATFLVHCFEHAKELKDGQSFRPPQAQHFTMELRDCAHFPPGHPQHNPHGVWHLR